MARAGARSSPRRQQAWLCSDEPLQVPSFPERPMTGHENPGFLRRMWTALGRAFKRGLLGKSSHDYMKQFTGSDEYWDRVIAAQLGWPQKQPLKPDPELRRERRGDNEDLPTGEGRRTCSPIQGATISRKS